MLCRARTRAHVRPSLLFRAVIALALLACCSPTYAQEAPKDSEGSDAAAALRHAPLQRELAQEGLRAVEQGDMPRAIRLFEATNELGELNVNYLNLGRALALAGRCDEAQAAYRQVETAPEVTVPGRDEVLSLLESYRGDLSAQCPGLVHVLCDDAATRLTIDGRDVGSCSPQPVAVQPGRHHIVASLASPDGAQKEMFAVDVTALETSSVRVTLRPPVQVALERAVEPPPAEQEAVLDPLGWGIVGAGVGTLAIATIVDMVVITPMADAYEAARARDDRLVAYATRREAQDWQSVNIGLFVTGSVLLVGGAALLLWGDDFLDARELDAHNSQPTSTVLVAPLLSDQVLGIGASATF